MNLTELDETESAKFSGYPRRPYPLFPRNFLKDLEEFAFIPKHTPDIHREYIRELEKKLSESSRHVCTRGHEISADYRNYFHFVGFGDLHRDVVCVFDMVENRMIGHYFDQSIRPFSHMHQAVQVKEGQIIRVKPIFKAEVWLLDSLEYEKFLNRKTESFRVMDYANLVYSISAPSTGEWHVVLHRFGLGIGGVFGTNVQVEVGD